MQLYSIVISQSPQSKALLSPCHFNQPMVCQAGAVVTFCADVNRFSQWCLQRGATPGYHNFGWFVNAAIDAMLASENFALEAENQGLGICYLGTTTYTAARIVDVLSLPRGVVPVTTLVVGYAAEQPELTPRLPLEAVIHYDKYTAYTSQEIDQIYQQTEESDFTAELLRINALPNLARVFTDKRYTAADNLHFSREYYNTLIEQGFFEIESK